MQHRTTTYQRPGGEGNRVRGSSHDCVLPRPRGLYMQRAVRVPDPRHRRVPEDSDSFPVTLLMRNIATHFSPAFELHLNCDEVLLPSNGVCFGAHARDPFPKHIFNHIELRAAQIVECSTFGPVDMMRGDRHPWAHIHPESKFSAPHFPELPARAKAAQVLICGPEAAIEIRHHQPARFAGSLQIPQLIV